MNATLRPDLLIELTHSNIRLSIENLSIQTIIEDTLKDVTIFKSPPQTPCVSIDETAIEKWVGLTRRIIAIERNYDPEDKALVRHIYDLNSIKQANKINDNFFILAKAIISDDIKQFKNQHQEYARDPRAEIKKSLSLLKSKPYWKECYQNFISSMVHEPDTAIAYENAIEIIEQISEKVVEAL